MTNDIQAYFLGGSGEIGSLSLVLDLKDIRLLLEYGLSPSKPPTYPLPAPSADLAMITHTHLDHAGMVPWLTSTHGLPILATPLTSEVATLLHQDTVKIAKMEGYASPYSNADVSEARDYYRHTFMNQEHMINDELKISTHNAGHIPGSLMYKIHTPQKTMLFTGDYNVIDSNLVEGAKPVPCDVLFMESTYAGREHPKRPELEKAFIDRIEEITTRGGKVIIPAFAVARSQELIMVLRKAGFNIWYDGMGRKVSKIFMSHPKELRNCEALKSAMSKVDFVYSDNGRKLASEKADVIITSSGMMDGGPVLSYVRKIKDDPKSAILLTGYQIEGTNSRLLVEHRKLDFYGVKEDINCEVDYFDFSGHAGHSELIQFAKQCEPEKIVLFHGDNREALLEPLKEFADVVIPSNNEPLAL